MKMNDESMIFGMTVRGFIVMMITMTLCTMTLGQMKIIEPFYSICVFVIGFYFGQKTSNSSATVKGDTTDADKTT